MTNSEVSTPFGQASRPFTAEANRLLVAVCGEIDCHPDQEPQPVHRMARIRLGGPTFRLVCEADDVRETTGLRRQRLSPDSTIVRRDGSHATCHQSQNRKLSTQIKQPPLCNYDRPPLRRDGFRTLSTMFLDISPYLEAKLFRSFNSSAICLADLH